VVTATPPVSTWQSWPSSSQVDTRSIHSFRQDLSTTTPSLATTATCLTSCGVAGVRSGDPRATRRAPRAACNSHGRRVAGTVVEGSEDPNPDDGVGGPHRSPRATPWPLWRPCTRPEQQPNNSRRLPSRRQHGCGEAARTPQRGPCSPLSLFVKELFGDAFHRSKIVLRIGPCLTSPVQAHRGSCQTGSSEESLKNFWSVPARIAKTVAQPGPKPRHAFVGSCRPKPDPYI
jgi:hypothetical protein